MYESELHPQPTMSPRRREEDDMSEDQLSYLPGSGPANEYGYAPPPGFVTAFWNPYEVKHRRRTSRAQLGVLEREFESDPKPNADKRRSLASQLNMTPRAIQVWFQNRRAKIKAIKNKIPGGRGMPKLKPAERAAARAKAESEEKDENTDWVQLSPEDSPLSSPADPDKPQFRISAPESVSGPASPSFPPPTDMLAPPTAAMLRRGSAPAPLQGIHRARYSVFNRSELEVTVPESPISPADHQVAPLRRPSGGLHRRPSLPDSHLRLPAHPYYPHTAPRMQRRGGLLSPVPDVSQEQEQAQYPPLPTMLPPAPAVGSSRMYRALPPGMGAVPAAHDLPTQLPARPATTWTPQRPFAVPVAGPLPAADFSFGAPEPGHGDAFNRVMSLEDENTSTEFQQEYTDFTWGARTRFGSMASIASDVTGVSVSSTQATSVSGGPGTATFNNTEFDCPQTPYAYPNGFQPDLRRASCPGEFLHQFSGMGVTSDAPRPSPLGRSLTIAPDSRGMAMINDAKSLRSPTFPPGQVDPTYPPPPSHENEQHMIPNPQMVSPVQLSPNQPPNQISPTGQRSLVGGGFGNGYEPYSETNGYASEQSGYSSEPNGYPSESQGGYAPEAQTYAPEAQSGYTKGYASDQPAYPDAQYHDQGYTEPTYDSHSQPRPYVHTPPSYDASPAMSGVPVLGPATNMEIINLNKEPMLFQDGYMINQQEYSEYSY